MVNLLSQLNATSVDSITQEQINGVMNTHYFIPILVVFTLVLFIFLGCLGLTLKGNKSKVKYYLYLFYAFIFAICLIMFCYFFVNTIYQILSSLFNY